MSDQPAEVRENEARNANQKDVGVDDEEGIPVQNLPHVGQRPSGPERDPCLQVKEQPMVPDAKPTEVLPTVDDLEVYRVVFELFDRTSTGYIKKHEVTSISIKLGLDPEQGKSQICLFF
jgi:hypothetical protein